MAVDFDTARQLLFAGATESVARRRRARLAKAQYLRRVPYRDHSAGEPALAWAFETAGHLAARRVYSALPPVPTQQPLLTVAKRFGLQPTRPLLAD